jgi:hypothetical protein
VKALHLQGNGDHNIQPLGREGSALDFGGSVDGHCSYITGGDWHDANRENNENHLPVVLEFDNFSGQEALLVRCPSLH